MILSDNIVYIYVNAYTQYYDLNVSKLHVQCTNALT